MFPCVAVGNLNQKIYDKNRNKICSLRFLSYLVVIQTSASMGRPKNTTSQPTGSELAVLQVLWQKGPSTAREVHDELAGEKQVRYTTTLKTMQVMETRGLIRREVEGQKHTFHAAIAQEDTQTALLDSFLQRAFGGSALRLVMKALGNYDPSRQELEQLKEIIRQKENKTTKNQKNDE